MSTEEKAEYKPTDQPYGISRREFLKNAGFVVGGATIGSMALLEACQGGATVTQTKTVTQTISGGGGATVTITKAGETGSAAPDGLVHLIVNDVDYWGVVKPHWTLAYVLREKLGLTGTKRGCNAGACGVCSVIMDGRIVESCLVLACEANGLKIQTIEGENPTGELTAMQKAFLQFDAVQCGFCTPGMIMNAKALLAFKPKPTEAEIKEFMSGTMCRCSSYPAILEAVKSVVA